jgi:hypothetical protein
VRPPKDIPGRDGRTLGYDPLPAPAEFFNTHKEQTDSYTMADVSPEDFDQAFEEAKTEGNLSRANIVHKVQDEVSRPAPRAKLQTEHHTRPVPLSPLCFSFHSSSRPHTAATMSDTHVAGGTAVTSR